MNFDLGLSVPALTVFLQGILSFFSPCVLPMLPLYIGYLSGNGIVKNEQGERVYDRGKVALHTFFFLLGTSFAFFALGLGMTALGSFFSSHAQFFARIGGVLVFAFGLYQLGVFGSSEALSQEHRLPLRLDRLAMSPLTAFLMGFTFSFAWTPCVGPALASVLLMTAASASRAQGLGLIALYTLGFVLPFLAVGLFTSSLLRLFRRHCNVVRYTVKIGAVLLLIMGVLMFTGELGGVSASLARESSPAVTAEPSAEPASTPEPTPEPDEDAPLPALDFTLSDQYGESHSLSDYRGKVIFMNLWATWCPPCRAEMPEIQKLYEEFSADSESEVVILGVAGPLLGQEGSIDDIAAFLAENGYTYPVLMDSAAELFYGYGISSFPTTIMIDREGNFFGYVVGQLSEETMRSIIEQTLNG